VDEDADSGFVNFHVVTNGKRARSFPVPKNQVDTKARDYVKQGYYLMVKDQKASYNACLNALENANTQQLWVCLDPTSTGQGNHPVQEASLGESSESEL
jgi:hypothetical protein